MSIQDGILFFSYVCSRDPTFWFYSSMHVRKLIWGEVMKYETGIYERKKYPGQLLFGMGFLIGVILPNFINRTQWRQSTASSMYLMEIFSEITAQSISGRYSRCEAEFSACGMQRCDDIWNATGHHGNACRRRVDWNAAHCISTAVWSERRPDWCGTSFSQYLPISAMHVLSDWNRFTAVQKTLEEPFFSAGQITGYLLKMLFCAALSGGDSPGSIL